MTFTILTLFPDIFQTLNHSIIKRACDKGLIALNIVNIRDFATDSYKTVDDRPYGGGVGMILRVDVVDRALQHVVAGSKRKKRIILFDARGVRYTQSKAQELASYDELIMIAGHYEGVDARTESLVDDVISIGDFVVTGGELPAMILVDSVTRLLPGVLKDPQATIDESHTDTLLAPPQYTRPSDYKGHAVPEVLMSGNHALIEAWKKKMQKPLKD